MTDLDIKEMLKYGINLADCKDVLKHADVNDETYGIYPRVRDGNMPKPGHGEDPWTPEMVENFRKWASSEKPCD